MLDNNSVHEECGIFGLFFPHKDFSKQIVISTLSGLQALQHRGEESAGIVVGDGQKLSACYKKMGLIRNLYKSYLESEDNVKDNLKGYLSISHTRYSTTGSSNINNAAPFVFESNQTSFAIAHNGNITNAKILKDTLEKKGYTFKSTTDSEIVGGLISKTSGKTILTKIINSFPQLEGSYCFIIATKNSLIGIRDQFGNRPLSFAEFRQDGVVGYAISSESSAFNNLNIKYKREIKPGEILVFTKKGIESKVISNKKMNPAFCGLEIAYLMRPDSRLEGIQLDQIRRFLGKKLAEYYPPPKTIDFVTYIPESAKSASEGYAESLSQIWQKPILSKTSILKNRYGNINGGIRGFISPNQDIRKEVANGNYHPFDILKGKEIVLIDDSIIRGTTTKGVIQTIRQTVGDLRNGGVKKIHLRIIFPPVIGYCPLGTDINENDELVAKRFSDNKKIAHFLKADSLEYLKPEEFSLTVNEILNKKFGLCLGCATGNYPISNFQARKNIFENKLKDEK